MWTLELFYTNDASMFVVSSPNRCGKTLNRIARARKGRCGWQGTPSTEYSCETGISTWHQALSLLRAELLTRFTTPVITPSPPYKSKEKLLAVSGIWKANSINVYQCIAVGCCSATLNVASKERTCQCAERFCVKNSATLSCTKIKLARPACGNCCIGT